MSAVNTKQATASPKTARVSLRMCEFNDHISSDDMRIARRNESPPATQSYQPQ